MKGKISVTIMCMLLTAFFFSTVPFFGPGHAAAAAYTGTQGTWYEVVQHDTQTEWRQGNASGLDLLDNGSFQLALDFDEGFEGWEFHARNTTIHSAENWSAGTTTPEYPEVTDWHVHNGSKAAHMKHGGSTVTNQHVRYYIEDSPGWDGLNITFYQYKNDTNDAFTWITLEDYDGGGYHEFAWIGMGIRDADNSSIQTAAYQTWTGSNYTADTWQGYRIQVNFTAQNYSLWHDANDDGSWVNINASTAFHGSGTRDQARFISFYNDRLSASCGWYLDDISWTNSSGSTYMSSGYLTSTTIDPGHDHHQIAHVNYTTNDTTGTTVRYKTWTEADHSDVTAWTDVNGISANGTASLGSTLDRYFQYRVLLNGSGASHTPFFTYIQMKTLNSSGYDHYPSISPNGGIPINVWWTDVEYAARMVFTEPDGETYMPGLVGTASSYLSTSPATQQTANTTGTVSGTFTLPGTYTVVLRLVTTNLTGYYNYTIRVIEKRAATLLDNDFSTAAQASEWTVTGTGATWTRHTTGGPDNGPYVVLNDTNGAAQAKAWHGLDYIAYGNQVWVGFRTNATDGNFYLLSSSNGTMLTLTFSTTGFTITAGNTIAVEPDGYNSTAWHTVVITTKHYAGESSYPGRAKVYLDGQIVADDTVLLITSGAKYVGAVQWAGTTSGTEIMPFADIQVYDHPYPLDYNYTPKDLFLENVRWYLDGINSTGGVLVTGTTEEFHDQIGTGYNERHFWSILPVMGAYVLTGDEYYLTRARNMTDHSLNQTHPNHTGETNFLWCHYPSNMTYRVAMAFAGSVVYQLARLTGDDTYITDYLDKWLDGIEFNTTVGWADYTFQGQTWPYVTYNLSTNTTTTSQGMVVNHHTGLLTWYTMLYFEPASAYYLNDTLHDLIIGRLEVLLDMQGANGGWPHAESGDSEAYYNGIIAAEMAIMNRYWHRADVQDAIELSATYLSSHTDPSAAPHWYTYNGTRTNLDYNKKLTTPLLHALNLIEAGQTSYQDYADHLYTLVYSPQYFWANLTHHTNNTISTALELDPYRQMESFSFPLAWGTWLERTPRELLGPDEGTTPGIDINHTLQVDGIVNFDEFTAPYTTVRITAYNSTTGQTTLSVNATGLIYWNNPTGPDTRQYTDGTQANWVRGRDYAFRPSSGHNYTLDSFDYIEERRLEFFAMGTVAVASILIFGLIAVFIALTELWKKR